MASGLLHSLVRKYWVILGLAGICVLALAWYSASGSKNRLSRPYRIGWERAVPEQFVGPDGKPTGVAVELVREAARRKGIELEWVESPASAEASLVSGKVDLWPLMTVTEERKKILHFSAPYLDSALALWVLSGGKNQTASSMAGQRVASIGIPINRKLMARLLPSSTFVAEANPRDVLEALCRGDAAGALLEQDEVVHELLRSGKACGDRGLTMVELPDSKIQLAVGSTKEAARAADAIRDGIDELFAVGEVDRLFLRWGYISGRSSSSLAMMIARQRRERANSIVIGLLGLFLVIAVWFTMRFGQESSRARKAEASLRRSHADLLEAQRLAGLASWSCDLATGDVIWSEELYRFAGLDGIAVKLDPAVRRKAFSAESWTRLEAAIDAAVTAGTPYQLDLEMIRPDAKPCWITVRGEVVRSETNQIVGLRGTALDITSRKEMLEALAAAENRLQLVVDSASLGTFEWEIATGKVTWNEHSERLFGFAPGGFQGTFQEFEQGLHPDDFPRVSRALEVARVSRTTFSQEFRVLQPDGSYRWVLGRGAFLFDGSDEPTGMYGVNLDINGQKLLEAQLSQVQKMESVGRLAGGIAHDFNNMLTVIVGYSERLRDYLPPASPGVLEISEIQKAAGRSKDLIEKLLGFSRQQMIEPVPLDLNREVEDLLAPLARMIGEDIELVFELGAEMAWVVIDPSQINQILLNLVVNARDAMPQGGRLTLRTECSQVESRDLKLHSECEPGTYVMLSVKDTGCGMTEDVLAHMFEPFFTTKDVSKGTGLGLATVYGIVRQNGGFIDVESTVGQGSCFKAYFPVVSEGLPIVEERLLVEEQPVPGSGTLLLVEDNELVRDLVSSSLEGMGYKVLVASSAEAAIELLLANPGKIQLMVSDVVMPRMNGVQLRDRVMGIDPDIRVLFMSGYASNVMSLEVGEAEGVHFIQKPFTTDELGRRLSEILSAAKH